MRKNTIKKIFKAGRALCLSGWFFVTGVSLPLNGQSALDQSGTFVVSNRTIPQALVQFRNQFDLDIAFSKRFFNNSKKITLNENNQPLREILDRILQDTRVSYRRIDGQIVLYLQQVNEIRQYTLSGYIQDATTGERLIAAAIYCPEMGKGTVSNEYGFFSLTIPETVSSIRFSYLGYEEMEKTTEKQEDQHLLINLKPSLTLAEVIVTPTEKNGELLPSPAGMRRFTPEDFNAAPDLGGQSDLIRVSQMLPGIQSGADGFDGMFVRGGNGDQNLILLDGVPVYNPYHLSGLFSIFNTSAIRSARLLKGGFPARYGGRISSVLDVYTRDGNQNQWSGEWGGDLISTNAMIEGPFARKKGAVLLSGRRSHSDFFLLPASLKILQATDDGEPRYRFYDFNTKLHFTLSEKDKLFLSFYRGNDLFKFEEEYEEEEDEYEFSSEGSLDWGNTITSFRWNHLFSQKLFSNTTLTFSKFSFALGQLSKESFVPADPSEDDEFYLNTFTGLQSDIQDIAWKTDFDYAPQTEHYFRFGAGLIRHRFRPGLFIIQEEIEEQGIQDSLSIEDYLMDEVAESATSFHAYVEDEFRAGNNWIFNLGLRFSAFSTGKKTFAYPEPRFQLAYQLHENLRLNASASRTVQFLHRIKSFTLNLPDDYWVPADKTYRPQSAWQTSLGIEGTLPGQLAFSLEGYYKEMHNLVALPDSFYLDFDFGVEPLEKQYIIGSGTSYGLEVFLRKTSGRTGGWFGYTLSKATREFDAVNEGRRYPFVYDRRHEVKLFLFHRFNQHWQTSLNFIYGSPNPVNILDLDTVSPLSGAKNSLRSTAYHRFDLSLSYTIRTGRLEHNLKTSVYNVYGRKNIAFYRLNFVRGAYVPEPVHLFGMRPGIHYVLKF